MCRCSAGSRAAMLRRLWRRLLWLLVPTMLPVLLELLVPVVVVLLALLLPYRRLLLRLWRHRILQRQPLHRAATSRRIPPPRRGLMAAVAGVACRRESTQCSNL